MAFPAFIESDLVMWEGDSIFAKNGAPPGQYRAQNGTMLAIDSYYIDRARRNKLNSFRRPRHVCFATSGATTAIVDARIAGEIASAPWTKAIIHLPINDAQTLVPIGTTRTNSSSIMTKLTNAGIKVFWYGLNCWGEKYPTGANGAVDAAIDAIDSGTPPNLNTIVTGFTGCDYCSLRVPVYGTLETALTNPANVTMASGCGPDAIGGHPSPFFTKEYTRNGLRRMSFT